MSAVRVPSDVVHVSLEHTTDVVCSVPTGHKPGTAIDPPGRAHSTCEYVYVVLARLLMVTLTSLKMDSQGNDTMMMAKNNPNNANNIKAHSTQFLFNQCNLDAPILCPMLSPVFAKVDERVRSCLPLFVNDALAASLVAVLFLSGNFLLNGANSTALGVDVAVRGLPDFVRSLPRTAFFWSDASNALDRFIQD